MRATFFGKKMDKINKRKLSDETRKRMSLAKIGTKLSLKTRKKISEAAKGRVGFWRNKKRDEITKLKISLSRTGKKTGDTNGNWKGDLAKPGAKHSWIYKHKGNINFCYHCHKTNKKKYEWANIDHRYRRNVDDYMRLCTSCHRIYDIKYNNYQKKTSFNQ